MSIASDLRVILLPALEEQLAASRHEAKAARLREFIVLEDRERAVVARIRQGANVALVAMQLRVGLDLRWVAPGFLEHVEQEKWAELVNDFAAASAAVVAAVNVKDILHGCS